MKENTRAGAHAAKSPLSWFKYVSILVCSAVLVVVMYNIRMTLVDQDQNQDQNRDQATATATSVLNLNLNLNLNKDLDLQSPGVCHHLDSVWCQVRS